MSLFTPTRRPFPADEIPGAVFDERPEWVALCNEAWRSAWRHVYESGATPVSPYMGEGCARPLVWIWDTSLMSFFCRYAFRVFPGVESLDNLYRIMSGEPCEVRIQHPDNPPLPAWAELEYFRFTGDAGRVRRILGAGYLERHYTFLESLSAGTQPPAWGAIPPAWRRTPEGYLWNGIASGMDNTPRGRGSYDGLLWFDAPAQLGLAALSIARLAEIAGMGELRRRFLAEYERKREIVRRHWDPVAGAFFDRRGGGFCRVLTPAVFWPMAAEMATPEQAKRLAELLADPSKLGGSCPCPTVSRDDPDFSGSGDYWRGAVWVPLVYMTAKALEKYGMYNEARAVSRSLLGRMSDTFREYEPHTIWECYKPDLPEPALNSKGRTCRADFCGWSALGPVALLIENVIGIGGVSASGGRVEWRISSHRRHGVRNLRVGENLLTLLCEEGRITVSCTSPFTLAADGREFHCPAGRSEIDLGAPAFREAVTGFC